MFFLFSARVCGDGEINRVPYDFVGKLIGEYSPAGSRSYLKIFTDLRITCDGLLNAWRFIPRNQVNLAKLHLAVFRQDESHDSTFSLVGETPFSRYMTSLNSMPTQAWAYLPIEGQAFRVKRGDYLGLFYDQTDLYFRDAPIYYTKPKRAGSSHSELISAVNSSFVYQNQQQLSMARAIHGRRTPALTAMVVTINDGSNSYFQGIMADRQFRVCTPFFINDYLLEMLVFFSRYLCTLLHPFLNQSIRSTQFSSADRGKGEQRQHLLLQQQ